MNRTFPLALLLLGTVLPSFSQPLLQQNFNSSTSVGNYFNLSTPTTGQFNSIAGTAGAVTGAMVTVFHLPPFIVTLAMMLVASGAAYLLTHGQSVYQVPDTFVWLGRGADFLNLPNAVLLMALLYVAAHLVMSRTVLVPAASFLLKVTRRSSTRSGAAKISPRCMHSLTSNGGVPRR